jgi:hypothetical protein
MNKMEWKTEVANGTQLVPTEERDECVHMVRSCWFSERMNYKLRWRIK